MQNQSNETGFTRADLLAITGITAIIVLLSIPALASSQGNSKAVTCINNLKQLTSAWLLYAGDNQGKLVQNAQGGDAMGGAAGLSGKAPWASGWLGWTTANDNTNQNFLFTKKYARLAPYYTSTRLLKCPADIFLSPAQLKKRYKERTRSVSLSFELGPINFGAGSSDPLYASVINLNQLTRPGPSETSVFLDEHPDSMNDPAFLPPARSAWVDLPASYHDSSGTFSFADGHVELHPWQATARASNAPINVQSTPFSLLNAPVANDPDISWVSYHTARASEDHY